MSLSQPLTLKIVPNFTTKLASFPVFKKPWVKNFVGREALNFDPEILFVLLAYRYTPYDAGLIEKN